MVSSSPGRGSPVSVDPVSVAASFAGLRYAVRNDVLAVLDSGFDWLPDRCVDLVLTDPPFNIARDTNFHSYERNSVNSFRFDEGKGWDTYTREGFVDLLGEWSAAFARVLRPGGSFAVFCADDYLSHLKAALVGAGLRPRRTLTWRKPNAVPVNRRHMMMSACEYVVVGVKGSAATFHADLPCDTPGSFSDVEAVLVADKVASVVERAVRDAVSIVASSGSDRPDAVAAAVAAAVSQVSEVLPSRVLSMYVDDPGGTSMLLRGCVPNHVTFNSKTGSRLHPTEKPVALLRYLVQLLSNRGDVVLDPFAGSGSTALAATELGRSAFVVERDEEFFGKMATRLGLVESV